MEDEEGNVPGFLIPNNDQLEFDHEVEQSTGNTAALECSENIDESVHNDESYAGGGEVQCNTNNWDPTIHADYHNQHTYIQDDEYASSEQQYHGTEECLAQQNDPRIQQNYDQHAESHHSFQPDVQWLAGEQYERKLGENEATTCFEVKEGDAESKISDGTTEYTDEKVSENVKRYNYCPVCHEPGHLKCSACGSVCYCSADHQKQHWRSHRFYCNEISRLQRLRDGEEKFSMILRTERLDLAWSKRNRSKSTTCCTAATRRLNNVQVDSACSRGSQDSRPMFPRVGDKLCLRYWATFVNGQCVVENGPCLNKEKYIEIQTKVGSGTLIEALDKGIVSVPIGRVADFIVLPEASRFSWRRIGKPKSAVQRTSISSVLGQQSTILLNTDTHPFKGQVVMVRVENLGKC